MAVTRKLARSQLNSYKQALIVQQGWTCPVSLKRFEPDNLKDAVVDHDHITGEIRGVLHRSANAVEGKVFNAVGRWGGVGMNYDEVIPYLKRLIAYLERPSKGVIYPHHKTEEERRVTRNTKAKEARARRLAQQRMKQS